MHPRIASRRGVVGLATDAMSAVTRLIETEVALAKAEIGEKIDGLKASLPMLIGGAVFLIAALFLLLQTMVFALAAADVPGHWAALIVAGGAAAVGISLIAAGRKRLDVTPSRTLSELSRDARVAKEHLP